MVVEEQSPQGLVDVGPMSMYKLIVSFEKRGHLDLKVTGHIIDRPAAVKRGEAPDAITVAHEAHSVFKPNGVTAKNVKGSNVAGVIGMKVLAASQYLQLVWRCFACLAWVLVSCFFVSWFLISRWNIQCNMSWTTTIIWGMRHYHREKIVGPAKPLWFARADIVLEANMYYQVA